MNAEPTGTKMKTGNMLAAELSYEAVSTRKMLERIPFETFSWKPHEKSTEIGNLAQHIARMPSFVKLVLTTNEFDLAAQDGKPDALKSTDELIESFDADLSEAVELLKNVSDEEMMTTWRLSKGEYTIFEMPRAGVIRSMVLSHLIHHRGQLSVYLRLNDIAVPSIYGPSADEQ